MSEETKDVAGGTDADAVPNAARPSEEGGAEGLETPPEKEGADRPDPLERPKRKKRRPKKRAEDRARRTVDPRKCVLEALRNLREAWLDLRERTGWRRLDGGEESKAVDLRLHLPLEGGNLEALSRMLTEEWRALLEKDVLEQGLLVPGRAWCFSSESFDHPSSRPEDPRQVLVGYGLEGRPRYADLVTLAIERKHESVEELLAGKEGVVHFIERGEDICEGVKPAFDPDAVPYRLVAQAMVGLFASAEEGKRVALTIQVLERKGEDGVPRLLVQPVCAIDLSDLPDPAIPRIVRGLQQKLALVAKQVAGRREAGEEADPAEPVMVELRAFARRLSHDARNRERKTGHARKREEEGARPTQLAFPEAKSARDHHLLIDPGEGTVVVIGKKGRIHVFSPDARHVTTVVMTPKSVRDRVRQGRWRPAEPEERGAFRAALERV